MFNYSTIDFCINNVHLNTRSDNSYNPCDYNYHKLIINAINICQFSLM